MLRPVSPCFTPGIRIATDRGSVAVENLRPGDRVVTRDNGLRRIAWTGRRDLTLADLNDVPELQPILVSHGALGQGPDRDMIVSPNHRFLIACGNEERLIAARWLVGKPGILPVPVLGVSYLHLLFAAHEVILADGVWTESFHPDDRTLESLDPRARGEILALFPEIETMGAARRFPTVRPISRSRSRFET